MALKPYQNFDVKKKYRKTLKENLNIISLV